MAMIAKLDSALEDVGTYSFKKSVCTLLLCIQHMFASLLCFCILALLIQMHIWKHVIYHFVSLRP